MALPEEQARLKFSISWDQFHQDTKMLAWKLKELDQPFIAVIAIGRGGLIPATIIAYELGIKYLDTYCISSYRDQEQTSCVSLKSPLEWNDPTVLVIDDLADTGETFSYARRFGHDRCHYASVYAKPRGKPFVDTFITEVSQNTWIYFPWD